VRLYELFISFALFHKLRFLIWPYFVDRQYYYHYEINIRLVYVMSVNQYFNDMFKKCQHNVYCRPSIAVSDLLVLVLHFLQVFVMCDVLYCICMCVVTFLFIISETLCSSFLQPETYYRQ